MKNLFKYAAVQWKSMLAIILILFVQAYCDLSLPAYTSDIVNVGIQQGGIEETVPEAVKEEEMEHLLLFVPQEEKEKILGSYAEDENSYDIPAYVLKEDVRGQKEEMEELKDILEVPMVLSTGLASDSEMTSGLKEQMTAALPSQALSEDMTVFDMIGQLPQESRETLA